MITGREYATLLQAKRRDLEKVLGCHIEHGSAGNCPSCGHEGFFDLKPEGLDSSSLFFCAPTGRWRCPVCDLEGM